MFQVHEFLAHAWSAVATAVLRQEEEEYEDDNMKF